MKILCVFGTRPEAIKMAPVVSELLKHKSNITLKICSTGQHKELLDQVLQIYKIKVDFDLKLMEKNQILGNLTINVLSGVSRVIKKFKPDIVLVHGDTTTSFAAALSAFYSNIKVAHIEAGLRSFVFNDPWPEEFNRRSISNLCSYHFAPTEISKKNLLSEGIKKENIIVTGNTVVDSLLQASKMIDKSKKLTASISKDLHSAGLRIHKQDTWNSGKRKMVLITGHRRENFGEGFKNICEALKKLSEINTNVDFVYPVHLNPNVRKSIRNFFGKNSFDKNNDKKNLIFIEPVNYLSFIQLMRMSYLVLTDSGGIQEEAPSLKKPVLLMRETTERPEAIKAGTVKKVGTKPNKIIKEVNTLLNDKKFYKEMISSKNPYGDGTASSKIYNFLNNLRK